MVLLEYMLEAGGFAPEYAHDDDACFDLRSPVEFILFPGQRKTIPLNIRFFVERGFYLAIFPRSGLARDAGISIVNTPGTIDAGYTGITGVTFINTDQSVPKIFRRGDKVCQGMIKKKEDVELVQVYEKPVTVRGDGGFGSTGQ